MIWVAKAKPRTTGFFSPSPLWVQAQSNAAGAYRERAQIQHTWVKFQPFLVGEVGWVDKKHPHQPRRGFEKFMLNSGLAGLKQRNVTRLIRIVRDWTANSEQAAGPIVSRNAFSAAHEYFHTAVYEADHPLLERDAEKSAWAWFSWWRSLTLVGLNQGVSGRTMLDLLKLMAVALRRCSLVPAPTSRLSISDRLERLANTIVSHAPPPLPARDELSAEVG